jgi:hypothetical protein
MLGSEVGSDFLRSVEQAEESYYGPKRLAEGKKTVTGKESNPAEPDGSGTSNTPAIIEGAIVNELECSSSAKPSDTGNTILSESKTAHSSVGEPEVLGTHTQARQSSPRLGAGEAQSASGSAETDSEDNSELHALRVACNIASEQYNENVQYATAFRHTYQSTVRPGQRLPSHVQGMIEKLEKRASDALAHLKVLESEFAKRDERVESTGDELPGSPPSVERGYFSFPDVTEPQPMVTTVMPM